MGTLAQTIARDLFDLAIENQFLCFLLAFLENFGLENHALPPPWYRALQLVPNSDQLFD